MLGRSFVYVLLPFLTVQAAADSAQATPAPTPQDLAAAEPDDAVSVMQEVYAAPEFWWKRTEEVENPRLPWAWLDKMLTALFGAIWKLLTGIFDFVLVILIWLWQRLGRPLGLGDYKTGALMLSVLLIALVAWLIWKLRRRVLEWLKSRETAQRAPRVDGEIQDALPEALVLLNQAIQAHQAALYREALRFAFLALLAFLQQRGWLCYHASRTNREYLHDLRELPGLSEIFRKTARPYERAWYGQLPVNYEEAAQVLDMCRQLVTQEGPEP